MHESSAYVAVSGALSEDKKLRAERHNQKAFKTRVYKVLSKISGLMLILNYLGGMISIRVRSTAMPPTMPDSLLDSPLSIKSKSSATVSCLNVEIFF